MAKWLTALMGKAAGSAVTGDGIEATEARDLAPFRKLRVEGAMQVTVSRGDRHAATIRGDSNIVGLVETAVMDDVLVLRARGSVAPVVELSAEVVSPSLESASLAGAGTISGVGTFRLR